MLTNKFSRRLKITNQDYRRCSKCLRIAEWQKPVRQGAGRQEPRLLSKSTKNTSSSSPKKYKFSQLFFPAPQVFLKFHFPYFLRISPCSYLLYVKLSLLFKLGIDFNDFLDFCDSCLSLIISKISGGKRDMILNIARITAHFSLKN